MRVSDYIVNVIVDLGIPEIPERVLVRSRRETIASLPH